MGKTKRTSMDKQSQVRENKLRPLWWSNEIEAAWKEKQNHTRNWQCIRRSRPIPLTVKEEEHNKMINFPNNFKILVNDIEKQRWTEYTQNISRDKLL
jgi:hypothetical protein